MFDFDANALNPKDLQAGHGVIVLPAPKVRAWFERGAELDGAASEKGGKYPRSHQRAGEYLKPVYRDVVMLAVKNPDPPFDVVHRKATPDDERAYPQQWAKFQQQKDLTPVWHLPRMTPAVTEAAKATGIWWIEQLAAKNEDELCDALKPFLPVAKFYLTMAEQFAQISQGQKPRVKLQAA